MRADRSWRALRVTPVLAAAAAGTAVLLGTGALEIPCWYHGLTGLDCPFCGGSRAIGALLTGDFGTAVGYNAFAVLLLVPLAIGVLAGLARWEAGRAARWWPRGRAAVVALVVVTAIWWLARDLPIPAFDALRS